MEEQILQNQKIKYGFIPALAHLWHTRDELSIRNIRLNYLHYFLPMVIVLILLDQRNTYFNEILNGNSFIFDGTTLVYGAYCLGSFIALLFFIGDLKYAPKIFTGIALSGFILWLLLPDYQLKFLFMIFFQFGLGGCAIYSTYAYVFILNNAERLFGILLVTFNYGLFIYLDYHGINNIFLSKILPFTLVLILAVCIFRFSRNDFPDTSPQSAIRPPRGIYIVLGCPFAFFAINVFGESIVNSGSSGFDMRGIGAIVAVFVSLTIQFVFRKSVWHMLNLFLVLDIIGISFMALSPLHSSGGALLFGVGDGLGYIMTFYMTGLIKRYSNDSFFKKITLATVVTLIASILCSDIIIRFYPSSLHIIAVIIAAFFLCMFLIFSPMIYRIIFSADWMEDFRRIDITAIKKQLEAKRAADNPLPVDLFKDFIQRVKTLTPTEKVIFNYCLKGKTNKEIISLMYISLSTLKTHNSHIYAKLNVSSRDELSLYIELIEKSGRLSDII
ncbi:MAG: helix-turn-helix transcriptional regulator [Bacillota bacterium]|nr:helix-turn-helix transcriptional regulator [Bacillota bacterium]